jgi:hypothetical protein
MLRDHRLLHALGSSATYPRQAGKATAQRAVVQRRIVNEAILRPVPASSPCHASPGHASKNARPLSSKTGYLFLSLIAKDHR